jgi:hypothetical protein
MKKKVIDINCLSKQQYIKPSVSVVELQQEGQILLGASKDKKDSYGMGKYLYYEEDADEVEDGF